MNSFETRHWITAIQFVLWWVVNSLYAIDVQTGLRKFNDAPLLFIDLTLVQIIVGIAVAYCIQHSCAAPSHDKDKNQTATSSSSPRTNLVIGFLHVLAVMLTNYSYRIIGSTSTLVWKLSEPFAAVLLKYLILKERTEFMSMAGVTFVVIGVLTYSVKSMSMFSASPIVLSNILFPTRNVVVKLSQKNDEQRVTSAQRFSAFLHFSLPFAVCIWTLKACFEPSPVEAFPFLLKNAVLFNTYQFVSIALLEKLDVLTHSLANTMKRFLGILLSAFLLKEHFTSRHITGLVLTALGFGLYVQNSRKKSAATSRSVLKIVLLMFLVLLPFGIMATTIPRNFLGDELAFPVAERNVNKTSTFESLGSTSEHLNHRAYMDSLKEVRPNLYVIPRAPQNMTFYNLEENDIWSFRGRNLGNLVWGRAAHEMLADFSSTTRCESLHANDCIRNFKRNDSFSSGLFYWPVANVFHEDAFVTLGFLKDRLKEPDLGLLVVGAGLQYSFDETGEEVKNTSTLRQVLVERFQPPKVAVEFLGDMERRSQTIMVRGDMTLQTLERAGFKHGISAGCPSLFLNREVWLGRLLERKYEELKNRIGDTSLKIGMNIANANGLFGVLLKIYAKYPQSVFFSQGRADLLILKKHNVSASRVRAFSNVDKWRAELQEMDVVLGGRIHGNMLGLGASVPTFVIAPDYRVLELVERMLVPHTTVFDERLQHDFDVAELMYSERMDGTKFDINRCGIAKLYRSVFERHGFGVSEHVWEISNIC